jgi:hypothetical protein
MKERKSMEFRTLRADEIELRVGTCKANGFSLLLYKDARCDMNILDETVGCMGWQRKHSRDNANCTVSIWDADKAQWIEKEDTGTESNTEKEKGLASDSFKRACVNFGIGRELYTAPFIWIDGHTKLNKQGKYVPDNSYDRKLHLKVIEYDENRNISRLVIKDDNNKAVFSYSKGADNKSIEEPTKDAETSTQKPTERDRPKLVERVSELIAEKNFDPEDVYKAVGVENLSQIETSRLPGMITWLEGK